jgi:hypothetical protein
MAHPLSESHSNAKNISILPISYIDCYVDASYGITADRRSQTGMSIMIGKGSMISKSTKQKIVTKSSTESDML